MAKYQQPPPLPIEDDPLPPPDPNNPVRKQALESALGAGPANPPGNEGGTGDVTPLPPPPGPSAQPPPPVAQPATQPDWHSNPDVDPFAAVGGGRYENGGWVPASFAPSAGAAAPAPGAPAAPAAGTDPDWHTNQSVDPFAEVGGGVFVNGGWVPKNHPSAAGATGGGPGGGLAPPSAAANPPGAGGGQATENTVQGAYKNALENLLEGPTPQEAGRNAAESPAVYAYRTQRKHQEGVDRALLAERNAAGGFSGSGGMETGILGLRQAAGRDIGSYAGEQASKAEAGRRQELLAAIATSQAMGDNASARALERELAALKHSEFEGQLNFDTQDKQMYYNQKALEALFGGAGEA